MLLRAEMGCSGISWIEPTDTSEYPGYLHLPHHGDFFIPNVNSDEAEDPRGTNHSVFLHDSCALSSSVGTHVYRQITLHPGSQLGL